jgi:hypothetical protein
MFRTLPEFPNYEFPTFFKERDLDTPEFPDDRSKKYFQ